MTFQLSEVELYFGGLKQLVVSRDLVIVQQLIAA
jgi:hypothetical protein